MLVIAIVVGLCFPPQHASARNPPSLVFNAPQQVRVGESIDIQLTVKRATNIAGYETAVLFDTAAARFSGLRQRSNSLKKIGRDVAPLAAVEVPYGAAIGLYSCFAANCPEGRGDRDGRGANGTVKLGTLTLIADVPGTLEVRFAETRFVDPSGQLVEVAVPQPSLLIQVGPDGAAHHPAPAAPWALATPAAVAPAAADLNGDGQVSNFDAIEVALEWGLTRQRGAPCDGLFDQTRDVNGDGCIDVADIQLVEHSGGSQQPTEAGSPAAAENSTTEADPALPGGVFVVNAVGDGGDGAIGNGVCRTSAGNCTLRAAIQEANAHSGPDTITFAIPGSGVHTIQLEGSLPALSDASGPTTIDGYTQPGAVPNTDPLLSNAVIQVQIAGKGPLAFDGLRITSPGNTVRGLALYQLRRSFWIYGSGAHSNRIVGNFVGTNATATFAAPKMVNLAHGLHIEQGAARNQIGGTALADRNVVSGNALTGVGLWHEKTDGNIVVNNIVGLGPSGDKRLANRRHGLDLNYGASQNIFGGTGPNERNVCSGNDESGIEVSHTAGTTQNKIVGNFIGTDVTGLRSRTYTANNKTGITIEDRASNNIFSDNVIGNNKGGGIKIIGPLTTGNRIFNNRIGVSLDGTPIPNNQFGILANGHYTIIGPGNIIAHNAFNAIKITEDDKDFNTITRNSIYGNGGRGIELFPAGVNPNDSNDNDTGPNEQLNYPVLSRATSSSVEGTACKGCTVEIFLADRGKNNHGQGKTFLGSGVAANDGRFTISISIAPSGSYVTATATDAAGNTSEFAANIVVS